LNTAGNNETTKGLDVEQHPVETSVLTSTELKSLEDGLRTLWERVRHAGEVIVQLREERVSLHARVHELETQMRGLDRELLKRESQIKEITAQKVVVEPKEGFLMANGEREALVSRVKDLLARIDAYL
jgi:chromosome segregation ATPase